MISVISGVLVIFLLHTVTSQGTPTLLQVWMSRGLGESAWSDHPGLAGLYWLESNKSPPVYRKVTGRTGWIYQRGRDWIIGYDTGEYQEGNKLSYVLPGLIQLGGAPGHHDGGSTAPRVPRVHGWLYLTKHREWNYDPGVTVSPRWSRETGGLAVAPCEVEEDVDYVGPELESLPVSSLSDCLSACLSNPVCRAVSLAAHNCSLKYSIQHRYSFLTFLTFSANR